ncbi:MAG: hypothetical protein JSS44_01940 [Proteobacteria bacterium]|nr:hypothetical protein [Pseudomonadota bacterium]MBS0462798.1 hypothetical protein [Pseudomonadota bacterium]MBS0463808.1 hypothetical protein [Pseudomonadota bacterium]
MQTNPLLRVAVAAAILAAGLSGCGTTYISDDSGHAVVLRNDVATISAKGLPDAVIDADGSLRIGGKAIATTPAQQALLKRWHDQLAGVRSAGIATGVAGVKLAAHSVADAVSGSHSAGGGKDPSGGDDRGRKVQAKALAICDNLDALQATQDNLAAALPAFKPYAALHVGADTDCRRSASQRHASIHPPQAPAAPMPPATPTQPRN